MPILIEMTTITQSRNFRRYLSRYRHFWQPNIYYFKYLYNSIKLYFRCRVFKQYRDLLSDHRWSFVIIVILYTIYYPVGLVTSALSVSHKYNLIYYFIWFVHRSIGTVIVLTQLFRVRFSYDKIVNYETYVANMSVKYSCWGLKTYNVYDIYT